MAMVILLLLLVLPFALAGPPWQVCSNGSKYAPNSAYLENLTLLSSTLPKKAASNATLFATDAVGVAPDTVFAVTLCRGDINASACEGCVSSAFQEGQQLCPYSKDATIYYDTCMLTFSNKNFVDTNVGGPNWNIQRSVLKFTASANSARQMVSTLINSTAQSAANSSRRFWTSRLDDSSFPTMYCLTQCRPNLTAGDCASCFRSASQMMLQDLDRRVGCRVQGTWCSMRYEANKFFQGDPMLLITASAAPPGVEKNVQQHRQKRVLLIIAVAVPLASILLCIICSVVWMKRRRKATTNRPEEDELVWRLEENSSEFTFFGFTEILHATCNFSIKNQLGRGGFGPVYKGLLPDGTEIAVKRLASHSGQGFTEFKNEVQLIAKLQHNNLVKLMGCCIQSDEKLLVYEYLPNKSLDFFIFDGNRTTLVDWNKRRAIIEGIAQGLLYLHKHSRLRIIHRDLKASNILLDQDMNPKIADFGLAKICSSNETQGSTNRIVGTHGYMSPEYASEGIYSIKSDVFSFGVLLLEILSGKMNSRHHEYGDFLNLLGYTWNLWEGGIWIDLLEVSIANEIDKTEAKRYINVALMCVQESAYDRPTMSDVVAMLDNESVVLPEPNHPAYFNQRVIHESASLVVSCGTNDVTITAEPHGR